MLQAAEIHARLCNTWPHVLASLGIDESLLDAKHHACPACGGKDRFRFDHGTASRVGREKRGSFYCNQCGSGDGFKLLQLVHGWDFAEARKRVIEAAGLDGGASRLSMAPTPPRATVASIAQPTDRVRRLRQGVCAVADCDEAVAYLEGRGLWPLPEGCRLMAHASAEYWCGAHRIGRYAAIVGDVVDANGELVTTHITYLKGGRKLEARDPQTQEPLPARKILSGMEGRNGCAVRLMPAGESLGIAEGLETALSATALEDLPTWAALNTALLAKFEPPTQTRRLVIYADYDTPGLLAAGQLMERLQERIRAGLAVEFRPARAPAAKDWNDILIKRRSSGTGTIP